MGLGSFRPTNYEQFLVGRLEIAANIWLANYEIFLPPVYQQCPVFYTNFCQIYAKIFPLLTLKQLGK